MNLKTSCRQDAGRIEGKSWLISNYFLSFAVKYLLRMAQDSHSPLNPL